MKEGKMNEFNISPKEIEEGKTMGGVAYITWIGLLIAFITGKENRYVMYHVQQALIVLLFALLTPIPVLGWIIGLGCLVFAIIGLLNGFGGKVQPVPVIGTIVYKFNLVKPAAAPTQSAGTPDVE